MIFPFWAGKKESLLIHPQVAIGKVVGKEMKQKDGRDGDGSKSLEMESLFRHSGYPLL